MAALPPVNHQCFAGETGLHRAAKARFTTSSYIDALLARGIDINEVNPKGLTALMIAAAEGHSGVAALLVDRGADVSKVGEMGITALHVSAGQGDLAITEMLLAAGANLEASATDGITPLQLASAEGHSDVLRAIVKAGANVDGRGVGGGTPLYGAAAEGQVDAVEVLLGAKANPLLTIPNTVTVGPPLVALDAAAEYGHAAVVRRMIELLGIEGCGGASRGAWALSQAATNQHVDVMAILVDAGVVDNNGEALIGAAARGREASVKLLLQQQDKNNIASSGVYVDSICIESGARPLHFGIGLGGFSSARIVRMLVDAGADTISRVYLRNTHGGVVFDGTPLEMLASFVREKAAEGGETAKKQLHELEAIRLVLLRGEAARALSWLWPSNSTLSTSHAAGAMIRVRVTTTPGTPLAGLSGILRRRAVRQRVLFTAFHRYSRKL
ncbi:unnamed protein product [Ectocarpus fasciculatus]